MKETEIIREIISREITSYCAVYFCKCLKNFYL